MTEPRRTPIRVTVLTGFLGSGKTTVLNHLLGQADMKGTAVIVNELGEIGIDDALISRASSDAVLLANGCICCTVKDDLTQTLEDLILQAGRGDIPRFARVIIETTGLADPAPILHVLMRDPLVTARYRMGGVVTTVDAVNGLSTLDRHPEAVHQAAVAERLLLTKADIASADQVRSIRERLAILNPAADLFEVVQGRVQPARLFDTGLFKPGKATVDIANWLRLASFEQRDAQRHDHHDHVCDGTCGHDHHSPFHHDHGIRSFAIVRERPIPWKALSTWLEAMTLRRGPDLLRMKGIVGITEHPDEPVVVHGVQDIFHPPVRLDAWPTSDRRTRIVFITRNMDKDVVENTLRHFEAAADDAARTDLTTAGARR